jgi:hypothetical protein
LLDALQEYSKVLELSSEPDLEIVFQVINLWLTNSENLAVNTLFDGIITNQNTQTNQNIQVKGSKNMGNKLKSQETLLSVPDFQYVLRRLVYRLCLDHPHHSLPLLFALAHEGMY